MDSKSNKQGRGTQQVKNMNLETSLNNDIKNLQYKGKMENHR